MKNRRSFLKHTGILTLGSSFSMPSLAAYTTKPLKVTHEFTDKWTSLRALFNLDVNYTHLANFLIASHPLPVREAIESHRSWLDNNPALAMDWDLESTWKFEAKVRDAAAKYLGVRAGQIALTGSTTEGLALIYGGVRVRHDQEILSTIHEHYSTNVVLENREKNQGTKLRKIRLFQDISSVTVEEILEAVAFNVRPNTRVLAMTWVHSGSGLKLPVKEIGELVSNINASRAEDDRLVYVIDGVHGLGVEDLNFPDMKCDFFIAGTHKWMFGPRGTGIICARSEELTNVALMFPTFSEGTNFGTLMSPGGYHSYEHRWALDKAFDLHLHLGKADVQTRIHQLNTYFKSLLCELPHVEVVTPMSSNLSAGFTFFRVAGLHSDYVASYLLQRRVITDAVSRDVGHIIRSAPGVLNDEAEIDRVVAILRNIS